MNPLIKRAREAARNRRAAMNAARPGGQFKSAKRKAAAAAARAKAKAKNATQKAASTARNAAQTHGIPFMLRTNMIPV